MGQSKSAIIALLILASGVFAQTNDESEIRNFSERYSEALVERNIDKFADLLKLDDYWRNHWGKLLEKGEFAQYPIRSYTVRWIRVVDDRAVARVYWNRVDPGTGKPHTDFHMNHRVYYFRKDGPAWTLLNQTSAENDLIARIVETSSFEERKRLIRGEPELNTHRILFVILYRLQSDGKYDETEDYYRLADWYNDEFFKGKDEFRFVNTILNILNSRAATQKSLGNLPEAMRHYLNSARIAEEYQSRTGRILGGTALTQINIGSLYFQQGNLEQAETFAQGALKTLENADRVKQSILFNSIYTLLGDIEFRRGNDPQALANYELSQSTTPHGIAAVHLRQGRLEQALRIYQASVEMDERDLAGGGQMNLPRAVDALTGISEILLRQNKPVEALKASLSAVRFAELSKNPELILLAQTALGNAHLRSGRTDEAEKAFVRAIEVTETGRQGVLGDAVSSIRYLESRKEPFRRLVELSVSKGDTAAALEFSERGKSRALTEILRVGRLDWRGPLDKEDQRKEIELRKELTELNRHHTILRYRTEPDTAQLAEVARRIERARLNYEFFQEAAFAKYPALRRSRGLNELIPASQVESMLTGSRQALVEFEMTENGVFLFVATRSGAGDARLEVYRLEGTTTETVEAVKQFREKLIGKDLDFKANAKSLFQRLFGKALDQLARKSELIIVPDGELWGLPFAALIDADGRFLIETRSVQLVQSLTALRELKAASRQDRTPKESMLAMGNPRLDEKTVARFRAQYRSDLGDLPDAETEISEIGRIYGMKGRFLTGTGAREDVWKSEASNYRYLHLATHGVANPYKPMYSHLLLSADPNGSDDGLLEAWEIMNLRLNADLAVLSACETASGTVNNGEGVVGLSWAFAVAGVPRVTASLWKVESAGTAILIGEFHRQYRTRSAVPIGKALQLAMIRQLRIPEYKHPYYWAGFVAIGR